MVDHETQPLLSKLCKSDTNSKAPHRTHCDDIRFCCRQVYLQYKAVVLILVWTMIVGELLAFMQLLFGGFIKSYVPLVKRNIITLLIQYHLPWPSSVLY